MERPVILSSLFIIFLCIILRSHQVIFGPYDVITPSPTPSLASSSPPARKVNIKPPPSSLSKNLYGKHSRKCHPSFFRFWDKCCLNHLFDEYLTSIGFIHVPWRKPTHPMGNTTLTKLRCAREKKRVFFEERPRFSFAI